MPPVRVLYFAWLRERMGTAEEDLALPEGIATVGALMAHLRARHPVAGAVFANPRIVRAAVNQDFAGPDTPVAPGDEVAFFPPITGG